MRTEHDSMGEISVPSDALYGASTQRAVQNFAISGHSMPDAFLRGLALVKFACAAANAELGRLSAKKSDLIRKVAKEIIAGGHRSHFPLDVFQTGSGTSTNTNFNEVVANRAGQLSGKQQGSSPVLHPNDDVNLGQSSNDVIPSALHVSVVMVLKEKLRPALEHLKSELNGRAWQFESVVKIGRTHLMDATPLTLGQEFSGYVAQVGKAVERVDKAIVAMQELALGGTAVGTGLNGHPDFAKKVCDILLKETGIQFLEARNHFEAQAARDDAVEVAGHLATIACSLSKIANDVRLLGSGPRCGLGEIRLPEVQPGSSIMPGKVNPVMCEMLVQVCIYVQGLVQMVVMCGREGHLELNATIPLIVHALHEAILCLSNGVRTFADGCIHGITANEGRCAELLQQSLMLVTALTPYIGYDKAALVAKKAFASNRTLREVVLEQKLMGVSELDKVLDPARMTRPQAVPRLKAGARQSG